ncbi:MAG: PTS glucose transporter subunit IIA [Blautia sp.]
MFFKKKEKVLKAYANGKIIPITEVEDQVFSQKIMGDGLAIFPNDNKIYSPCDGKISAVFEQTQHAVGITLNNGIEVIIHVGLDTVNLTEPVFQTLVKMDEQVKQGQTLITYDKEKLKELGYTDVTMCVIINKGESKNLKIHLTDQAVANETDIVTYK